MGNKSSTQTNNNNQDDFEEINIDFDIDPTSSENSISDLFTKLDKTVNQLENKDNNDNVSSPFISTELYNKIMKDNDSELVTSSPFIKTEDYKKIIKNEKMTGGKKKKKEDNYNDTSSSLMDDSDSDTDSDSDSDSSITKTDDNLLNVLSNISLSSSDYPNKNRTVTNLATSESSELKLDTSDSSDSNVKEIKNKTYNFSETSPIDNDVKLEDSVGGSDTSYFLNNNSVSSKDSEPYKLESSDNNTSDINLVSVDSVNGRRYIN